MFEVFGVMRQLHALLMYLSQALTLRPARPLYGELRSEAGRARRLLGEGPDALMGLDVASHKSEVNDLLVRVSDLVRAQPQVAEPGAAF